MRLSKIFLLIIIFLFLGESIFASDNANEKLKKALSKESQPKEVLSQFERDYILLKKGVFELENNFSWTYNSANQIFLDSFAILDPVFLTLGQFGVENIRRHILSDTVTLRYGVLDNLQTEVSIPIIYRYDRYSKVGTTGEGTENAEYTQDKLGIGDISIGLSYQPLRETDTRPGLLTNLSFKFKNAKSPFEIKIDQNQRMEDVPLGSGYYSVKAGVNMVKTIDPVVVFGGVSYAYNIEESVNQTIQKDENITVTLDKVYPGDTISIVVGLAYAVSYDFSIGFQFQDDLTLSTEVEKTTVDKNNGTKTTRETATNTNLNSAIFKLTAGWTLSENSSINFNVGLGLTSDAPDFVFEVRYPIRF